MTVINKEQLLSRMVNKLRHEDAYTEDERNILLESILMVYVSEPDKDVVPTSVFKLICEKCNRLLDELEELENKV